MVANVTKNITAGLSFAKNIHWGILELHALLSFRVYKPLVHIDKKQKILSLIVLNDGSVRHLPLSVRRASQAATPGHAPCPRLQYAGRESTESGKNGSLM